MTTLTNDTRIFIGAEAIADRFYPLPFGWDAAYEVKPIGNRILNWIFYRVADTFVPFIQNHYFYFGVLVKACALSILLVCCWYISHRLAENNEYAFPLLSMAFICQANFGIMMSEWFAVLFSLVAVAFCLEQNKNYTILAGSLLVGIALLKGITLFMAIPVMCAVILLGGSIDFRRLFFGYLIGCTTMVFSCLLIWPYQIQDILMSGMVAHVGKNDATTLLAYFWITQTGQSLPSFLITYVPIIMVGTIAALLVLVRYYSHGCRADLAVFMAMWIVPAGIVLVQSEFIGYHYLVLAFPGIISILILLRDFSNARVFTLSTICILFVTFMIFNSYSGSYSVYERSFWDMKEHNADIINENLHLSTQSSILYLDPGDAAYYFHANSSCRYIAPMPVQRHNPPSWNMSKLSQYTDLRKCILQYNGEFIVTDVAAGSQYSYTIFYDHDISQMITSNYTKVISGQSWDVFKRKDTF